MTEYDYSPEAYERYLATQQRISKWVATTEGYRNEFGNALTVLPSQIISSSQPRGQLPSPQPTRSSHSQHFQDLAHSQPCLTSSCKRSAVDIPSRSLQHSKTDTSPRSSASAQNQRPQTVSQHASSGNVHMVPSQNHTTKTPTTYVAVSHPQKPLASSRHASIQSEVCVQQPQDANVASQRSITSTSHLQKAPLRHHASTPQLEVSTRQTPSAYMITIPPSEKTTYIYAPSGWVPSDGLVVVPSKGQSTSIAISLPASNAHVPMSQIPSKGHTQPTTPGVVMPSPIPQTSPHASSSQVTYPPVAYVPVPVVIIERERRSKNVGVKKSKKKDKRSRSKARS
ncbi:hypothetical protein C0992_012488 [Termitomyces sp. T32_za158]|nr:hypothetical protein C0992_012488 [Termitomyces sp. T32_za158]